MASWLENGEHAMLAAFTLLFSMPPPSLSAVSLATIELDQ